MQRGSITNDVVFPTLRDFLKITQLSKYEGKLKKLKCVETEDLKNLAGTVGFLHVEEQRIKRYLDHFHNKTLVQHEAKQQPITLDNFFTLAKLAHAAKSLKKFGIVEFDDLPWMAYADRVTLLPKPVELNRFTRYYKKILDSPDIGKIEEEAATNARDLQTFLEESKLKGHKSLMEKLGVVETDDLQHLNRSDLSKLKQVEFERFVRYREKYSDSNMEAPSSPDPPSATDETDVNQVISQLSITQLAAPNQNQIFNFNVQGAATQMQYAPQHYPQPAPSQPTSPPAQQFPVPPIPAPRPPASFPEPIHHMGWQQQQSFDQYHPANYPPVDPMFRPPPYNPDAPPSGF